ncbi:MAG: aminoglycoside phosphotransferase family protein [Nocardioides sp.]
MRLPDGVRGMSQRGPDWAGWVDRLPRLVNDLMAEWGLCRDGWPMHGYCSLVVPALSSENGRVVLKLTFDGDEESEHEHLALRLWDGQGAVRMLRADPARRALLLERLHATDLRDMWDIEACQVVAGLYPRLHLPAQPQLHTLTSYVARWLDQLEALGSSLPVPRRMVEQALHLGRALVTDAASTAVVIHGDLHYANVLAGDRQPWLAIDPKPMNGDPHYEIPPLLWNRWEEMAGDLRGGIRRRFHATVDAAGLDEARARDWAIVRMIVDASWTVSDARREDRDLTPLKHDRITRCVAIVKAVQD